MKFWIFVVVIVLLLSAVAVFGGDKLFGEEKPAETTTDQVGVLTDNGTVDTDSIGDLGGVTETEPPADTDAGDGGELISLPRFTLMEGRSLTADELSYWKELAQSSDGYCLFEGTSLVYEDLSEGLYYFDPNEDGMGTGMYINNENESYESFYINGDSFSSWIKLDETSDLIIAEDYDPVTWNLYRFEGSFADLQTKSEPNYADGFALTSGGYAGDFAMDYIAKEDELLYYSDGPFVLKVQYDMELGENDAAIFASGAGGYVRQIDPVEYGENGDVYFVINPGDMVDCQIYFGCEYAATIESAYQLILPEFPTT